MGVIQEGIQDQITNFSLVLSIAGGGLSTVVETLTEEAAASQHLWLQKQKQTNISNQTNKQTYIR